jgi:hypothetical protein
MLASSYEPALVASWRTDLQVYHSDPLKYADRNPYREPKQGSWLVHQVFS